VLGDKDQTELALHASGSERLSRALKAATWVKPGRDREMNYQV